MVLRLARLRQGVQRYSEYAGATVEYVTDSSRLQVLAQDHDSEQFGIMWLTQEIEAVEFDVARVQLFVMATRDSSWYD